MNPIYTGQNKLTPQQRDNETLAEAIERHAHERAKREPLLADQGKMDGGLDESQNDTICKFGIGEQDAATCRMIYVHFPGYYVTEQDYQDALSRLCPNLRWEDEVET